jgi:uncharacterized repeat protein (TIGR01451 family)
MCDGGAGHEPRQVDTVRMNVQGSAVKHAARWVAALVLLLPLAVVQAAPCDIKPGAPTFIEHDLTASVSTSNSWCELCGYGYVTIVVSNPYSGATMTGLTVVEDLRSSGLTYAPGAPNPIRYRVNSGAWQAGGAPAISGTNGSVLTWTSAEIPPLASLGSTPGSGSPNDTVAIIVAVTRAAGLTQEGLISADRTIRASVSFTTDSACADAPRSTGLDTLPLREPVPSVAKTGWNYDAGQREGSATASVYGHNNDDIVWRIRVTNNGLAGLQDLRFDDLMQSDSLVISYACPTAAAANAIAGNNGVLPGGSPCVAASNGINDFIVTNPYGAMGTSWDGREVDALANGGTADIYLVGKVVANGSCITARTNTVSDIQWGCEADAPAGGIASTSTGATPADAVATLYTRYGELANLGVERRLTGTNTSQPVGSKGTMTITIRNRTGGSVRFSDALADLKNVLPVEYVVDPTFTPTAAMSAPYGSYPGMVDRITWTNPVAGTFPLTTTDPAVPLGNTAPEFNLWSSTVHPLYADQRDMMRHGDTLTVRFRVVLIRPAYYDRVANLDVREEAPTNPPSDPPGTDPANQTTLSNTLTVRFETLCAAQGTQTLSFTGNGTATTGSAIPANPEDLDVDIAGAELIFILTNDPNQRLPLTVQLRNRGGHDARDFSVYVSFGQSMSVVTVPGACSATGNPPALPPWRLPAPIPATAAVYRCTQSVLTAGNSVSYGFEVIKNAAAGIDDDLSFRADVIGEITLSDGTPLWFPAIVARADGVTDRANNYSLDGIRARVIGFNLLKNQSGNCTENNPPPATPDRLVQIGEECSFGIESGGWFGFQTPGFQYIAVQDIQVVDQLPDGQGYISSTDPFASGTTGAIQSITLNPAGLQPLDEGWIDWRFNRNPASERITVKDEWFRVGMSARLLNDPIDTVAAPNRHAALSSNVLNAYFQAVFYNDLLGREELFNLGPNTVGYPREAVRRVDLTVTEPRITVVKEVCNETLYGVGPACSNFVPLADNGDAYNSYVYRIRITNEAAASGVARAPAYDVTATDILDASDLAYVLPFASDGLDNDGDGLIDGVDSDGEGTISDNTVKNATPATLTLAYTHSAALRRINAGQTVTFYYRVDYDDDAAPLQPFTNRVTATYDSLENASGNQGTPQRPNSDKGGARVYTSDAAGATVRIIPVLTQPKAVARLSATTITGASPQAVAIGEEAEYRLTTRLPVALLRQFAIRDELPAGIRCTEAPAIDLDAAPYASAGFEPGGVITPTCTDTRVEWSFGDQRITRGTTGNYYDFTIGFIARVDNSAANNDGTVIRNGGTATSVTATYVNQAGATVTLSFAEAAVVVREPAIALVKAFSAASADAGDVLTVTVTATNSGSGNAYNLQVLDDLTNTRLSFLGSLGGADPPDAADTATLGANRPIFRWNPANPDFTLAPGASLSFSFAVRVDADVEPQELLDNTVQARWQSLPGQSTALNSTGLIGPDGSLTGLRNGALPNAGHAINDYETTATASSTVPALATAKSDLSPAVIPTIGAYKQFEIEIRLPEGVSRNVAVSDNLAASGISYLLANNASYDITYSFEGIVSVNGQTPGEAAFLAFPADESTGTVVWNIGTVVTASENDTAASAITPAIRLRYWARVNNDLVTDAGDALGNSVAVSYRHGETGASATVSAASAAVTVVEPRLTLAKTLANVTAGKGAGDPPAAGDILEYRVTATNAGTATAFDVNVVDAGPSGVVLYSGFTPTATINGVPVTGFVATPAGAPAGPLTWGRENGDGGLDVPAGETLIVTYRALVQVIVDPAGVIENRVRTDWTSLNGDNAHERTGTGCPNFTAPNDYCVANVTATVIGTRPVLRFEKSVFNVTTGRAQPAAPAYLTATPGDVLRYTVRVQNISSTPPANFDLLDELDRLNASAMFVPGSLALVTVPAGADSSNTSATGGARGTGLVDVRGLTLGPAGGGADTVRVVFEARLVPVIADETLVRDQAQMFVAGVLLANSDDPIVNGAENPGIVGDEDPTPVRITSAPSFRVQKTATDLTGDPAVLMAGDTLRYTITVKNIGTEDAVNVTLRDAIPANTRYVADSTTLNGAPLGRPDSGVAPLAAGILINAPENATPGALRADASAATGNVATITFDVVIDSNVLDGTVISNQGFVNGSGSIDTLPEKPSDDPATAAPDDPTRKVVGNLPLIYAVKTVQLVQDFGTPGVVEVNDVLRYTFTITNTGARAASGVALIDSVPNNTTYVADSLRLNGLTVAGAFPPAPPNGVAISSSDLTPPLPAPGAGTLSVGGTATVTFDVVVASVPSILPPNPPIPVIRNQGTVASAELIGQLTDADGDPSNGLQPTEILVGSGQALTISKQVAVVGGGAALPGAQLEYTIVVRNVGTVAATNVVLTDAVPAGTGYVADTVTLNGLPVGRPDGGVSPLIAGLPISSSDLTPPLPGAGNGTLSPGGSATVRFRVGINAGPAGSTITNTAVVSWNTPAQSASASASVDIGGVPGSGILNGRVWHDADFGNDLDASEAKLAGWSVQLYANGTLRGSVLTDTDGRYTIAGLVPNDGIGDRYELRFRAPGAGANTAALGRADSVFTDGLQTISGIVVASGGNLQDLNLPIDPDGVVYNSVLRTAVAGAVLALARPGAGAGDTPTPVAASCLEDPLQQGQVTLASGYYKFDLRFGHASCPAGGDYLIVVTPPAASYAAPSVQIPPTTSAATAAYSVPLCPADALASPAGFCEAQASEFAPAVGAATPYYLHLTLGNGSIPGESQLFNNHLPLDPRLSAALAVSKAASMTQATRGQLVPYTITVRNTLAGTLGDLAIVDTLPPGFKYVPGSARANGVASEPAASGRELRWSGVTLAAGETYTLRLLLVVGAGVSEGEYVNRVLVVASAGSNRSNEASATVRVVPDPTFDCSDVIGKVFDDVNANGYQDRGEPGLAGVRVVSARGLIATTDKHGRYHVSCAAVPDEDRGSNFILKLDERSLPSGYRVTTENPLVRRATRGKMIKFNFGAGLHRVVRLDLSDAVFEPDTTDIRPQWRSHVDTLIAELRKAPSVLRLSYLADVEDPALAARRLESLKQTLTARWRQLDAGYALGIETETYWRRGAPPARAPTGGNR